MFKIQLVQQITVSNILLCSAILCQTKYCVHTCFYYILAQLSLVLSYFALLIPLLIHLLYFFQTLLRIWDCFLLEGPKVLFRFSMAILKIHEKDIIQRSDTISVMRHVKASAKLSFDVEGLVKVGII